MTYNKPNPDDRSDNVEKLQDAVQNTIENIDRAEESLEFATGDEKQQIMDKNERRRDSIQGMRNEIKDEDAARKNGYQ
ncbi:small acid-soluble spore protein Tlp [Peribacillus sp. B-H-3]|uniref:small acid-soluble spore protein Tlp n=1 Tax=Bacillaceae TaxID=186817 RepID=UPI0008E9BEB9|nr:MULTISPECIES: small acid-soluble spore protein Tlp [unclassified Bacillus (in: firmicutes)]OIK08897.1 small acid-soluble spore protein Tlp [Bacillus sp. MUM 13]SFC63924.1 small acid-soluble spore protein (thioredoxin-like protein) [Bacillus sp. OV322]